MPALILLGLALVSFVAGLFAHGNSSHGAGVILGCVSAVLFVVSGVWFFIEHRRVRRIEEHWYAEHPDTSPQDPTS